MTVQKRAMRLNRPDHAGYHIVTPKHSADFRLLQIRVAGILAFAKKTTFLIDTPTHIVYHGTRTPGTYAEMLAC